MISHLLHIGIGHDHGLLHIWILVILGVLGNIVYYSLSGPGMAVRRAITRSVRTATGLAATLEKAELPLRRGKLSFRELVLPAPEGSEASWFARVDRGEAELTAGGAVQEQVHVPAEELGTVELHLDWRDGRGSFHPVIEALEALAARGSEEADQGRLFFLREVRIAEVKVFAGRDLASAEPHPVELTLRELRFFSVGRGRQAPGDLPLIAGALVRGVLEAVAEEGRQTLDADLAAGLRAGLSRLGGLGHFETPDRSFS